MNIAAPELTPIFRSDSQAEILARLLLNPGRSYSIAELARLTGTAYASAHREVRRLVRGGILTEDRVGQASQVAADTSSPAHAPLRELLLLSYGPAVIVPRVLAGISNIDEAYLYGSWAARRSGESGSPPADVDVLVVGNPSRSAIHEAADEAETTLGREVNIRIVSPESWSEATDTFIATVRERPLMKLDVQEA